jgi:hypothetical protein
MQALLFWARGVPVIRQEPQRFLAAAAPTPPGHQLFLGQASQTLMASGWLKYPGAQPATRKVCTEQCESFSEGSKHMHLLVPAKPAACADSC